LNVIQTTPLPEMLLNSVMLVGGIVVFMYVLRFLDGVFLGNRIAANYAIKPRGDNRLLSVVLAHYLHANRRHLFANTVPFFILAFLIAFDGLDEFAVATIIIMLIAGVGTWLFGSQGVHLGASGLITGYFGFVILRGWVTGNVPAIIIGIFIGIIYFGILGMVFARRQGASNVMHFFGFLGGLLAAWVWSQLLAASVI
jgi:membrane associated rhomboid family serine protease